MTIIRLTRAALLLGAGLSLLYYVSTAVAPNPGPFDDAYMFVRYAKHAISGHGFSWNAGEGPVYGVTSALYLFEIVALRGLTSLSDTSVLLMASVAAGVAACGVIVAIAFLLLPDGPLRRAWVPIAAIPLLVLSPLFVYHTSTGMETTLSLLANSILVLATLTFTGRRSTGSFAACLLAAYVSYLARPDNAIVALLFPPLYWIASDRRLLRSALWYLPSFTILAIGDTYLKTRLFGDGLPLAFYAKQHGFYSGYVGAWRWNPVAYMLAVVRDGLPWLLLVVLFVDKGVARRIVAALVPPALTFVFYLQMTQIMGLRARYYYPFLPFLVLAALVAVAGSSKGAINAERLLALRTNWKPRMLLAVVLITIITPPVRDFAPRAWQSVVVGPTFPASVRRQYITPKTASLPYVEPDVMGRVLTAWLRRVPAETVVAASEYGFIGSELPDLTIIDVLGLHDRQIARRGFSAERFFDRHPDVIWLPHDDYSALVSEIVDARAFGERYEYYPGVFRFGLALDRTSPRYDAIKTLAEQAFSETYGGQLADCLAQAVEVQ